MGPGRDARCAYRNNDHPDNFNDNNGFRVVFHDARHRAGKPCRPRTRGGARNEREPAWPGPGRVRALPGRPNSIAPRPPVGAGLVPALDRWRGARNLAVRHLRRSHRGRVGAAARVPPAIPALVCSVAIGIGRVGLRRTGVGHRGQEDGAMVVLLTATYASARNLVEGWETCTQSHRTVYWIPQNGNSVEGDE